MGARGGSSMSSLHLANELGFFRKAGFDLEILQSGGASQAMALLAGEELDVLFGSFNTACLNAVIKGLPIRIVAGREVALPTCGNMGAIYGMRRTFPHGLADITQLKGKRVATGPMIGLAEFALDAHLAGAGLSTKDVTTVSLDFRQNVAALLGGGVDAMVVTEDFDRDLTSLSAEIVHIPGWPGSIPIFSTPTSNSARPCWRPTRITGRDSSPRICAARGNSREAGHHDSWRSSPGPTGWT